MSEIWLVLAVGSAFFAVVLGGLAVEQSMSDKKRAVRLLESHVSVERVGQPPRPSALQELRSAGARADRGTSGAHRETGHPARHPRSDREEDHARRRSPRMGRRADHGLQGDRCRGRCRRRPRADDHAPARAVHLVRGDRLARVRRVRAAGLHAEPPGRRAPEGDPADACRTRSTCSRSASKRACR